MLKGRKNIRGQAFAEMVICLIPMLFIFMGIFIVGIFGLENLKMTILARTLADSSSAAGYLYNPGEETSSESRQISAQYIRDWSYGEDLIPFTADDSPVTSGNLITANYSMRQTFDTSSYTVGSGMSSWKINNLMLKDIADREMVTPDTADRFQVDSDSADLAGVFLESANLFGVESSTEKTLEKYGFSTGNGLYMDLAGGELTITGKAFMPSRKYISNIRENSDSE